MRLILVLLVKNEADIIEANIRWHLSQGVDFIVATDNGSTDDTPNILDKFARKGVLHLINDDSVFYQSKMVTHMTHLARDEFGADWVIPCDADELWTSTSGNLRDFFVGLDVNMFSAKTFNFATTTHDDWGQKNPVKRLNHKVANPLDIPKISYILKPVQEKVAVQASDFRAMHEGNHWADMRDLRHFHTDEIQICHYPIRTREQFFDKVVTGGKALEDNKALEADIGYHWRRWYRAYKRGRLEWEWRRLLLGPLETRFLTAIGCLCQDTTVCDALT